MSVTFPALRQWIISSIAAAWSQTGGAHYTAASLYQQRVADAYHGKGVNIISGAFGPFKDTGMAARFSEDMRALGLVALEPEETVPSFAAAASRGRSSFVYADILPETLISVNSLKGRMAVFDGIAAQRDGARPSPSSIAPGDVSSHAAGTDGGKETMPEPGHKALWNESDVHACVMQAIGEHLGITEAGDGD
ncbi:MAG: hypothetical protein GY701_06830, partial [Sulfitobacter sp.]|nr:hypothetical protein [Sulfitobacter sp.]